METSARGEPKAELSCHASGASSVTSFQLDIGSRQPPPSADSIAPGKGLDRDQGPLLKGLGPLSTSAGLKGVGSFSMPGMGGLAYGSAQGGR